MAATQFETEPLDLTPNPNRIDEPRHRAARFLKWEVAAPYCRKVITVDNSADTTPIQPGTVLIDGAKKFRGILFGRPVMPGAVEERTVIYCGPSIVEDYELIYPADPAAADADADGAVEPAEQAAADAALKANLQAEMAAVSITIR